MTYRKKSQDTLDMSDEIAKNLTPDQVAIIVAAFLYILKEITHFISNSFLKTKDKTEENTTAVKELNANISHLASRIALVEASIDKFTHVQSSLIKVEKDIHYAFEKIRDIKSELSE